MACSLASVGGQRLENRIQNGGSGGRTRTDNLAVNRGGGRLLLGSLNAAEVRWNTNRLLKNTNTGKFNFDGGGNLLTAPTGTQNVSGTVNAEQAGPWNVNVTNFPTAATPQVFSCVATPTIEANSSATLSSQTCSPAVPAGKIF